MARFRLALQGIVLIFSLGGCSLAAQDFTAFEKGQTKLDPKEQETVDFNRRLAKPRMPVPAPGLSPEEKGRNRAYNRAKNSVVFIHSIPKGYFTSQFGDEIDIPPASGTGFVWDNLGHVVTNYHVITFEDPNRTPRGEADELRVTLADGRVFKAVVIGRSLTHDIAVLHVFAPLDALKPLPIGTSRDLQMGQDVLAIGNPFGLDHTLTSGIISGLGRNLAPSPYSRITGAIQTDAAINPGNSGGPLLDRAGHLVGMNTAITSSSGSSAGVGFAIPVDTLNKVVPLLIAKGQTFRPALGFTTLGDRERILLRIPHGILVADVTPGSVAAQAGLRASRMRQDLSSITSPEDMFVTMGDVIIGVNGQPMDNGGQLMDFLELTPPAKVLVFDILRDGKAMKITLHPEREAKGPEQHT